MRERSAPRKISLARKLGGNSKVFILKYIEIKRNQYNVTGLRLGRDEKILMLI